MGSQAPNPGACFFEENKLLINKKNNMEVVAQTNGGFLLQANETELKEIISSVTGTRPDKIAIGQKIPAIDYASTITKIKLLKDNSDFQYLNRHCQSFNRVLDDLNRAVERAANIEL